MLCFLLGETEATPTRGRARLGAPGSVNSAPHWGLGARWGGMLGVRDAELEGWRRGSLGRWSKKWEIGVLLLAPNAVGAARCPAAGTDSAPAPGSEGALKV